MNIEQFAFPLEQNAVSDNGRIKGYGSVFGELHYSYAKVMPGAFDATLAEHKLNGTAPVMLWQHNTNNPIGVWDMGALREDSRGLYTEGDLLINDVAQAREAHALLRHKAIRGLSIGFIATRDEYDDKTGIRMIHEVDLHEISLVTFPNCPSAGVDETNSADLINNERNFEAFLREAGFPRKMSHKMARRCSDLFRHEPREEEAAQVAKSDEIFKDLRSRLTSLTKGMNG